MRWIARGGVLAIVMGFGCGGSTARISATGSIYGVPAPATSGLAVLDGSSIVIIITSFSPAVCPLVGHSAAELAESVPAAGDSILMLTPRAPNGAIGRGTYPIGSVSHAASFGVSGTGGSCAGMGGTAGSGAITLSAVSMTSVSGTYDLDFGADHVTGSFDVDTCASGDAGSMMTEVCGQSSP